ncbi:putative Dol-P-Glc:Glc(2)Man(9)GlcNAc(2)-PP-Dol alpha-1,2-glucosyltransferase [Diorhabda sublineata]|uniref:putative Dol-P-Glc:Glc(2)Man(9)GlcNAc(2)-PP-Dol alpha-1,2-glucosyltransferase n=1 Tax=Diorhabda sublineata TaxID=1163346 RepID=UPI0024E15387|nr:putative Dol-P-Glc:Glc(2)Man(9)GlcNAc(2)-PP-Dol alpha-1,2-glucosyltransferase [Diorhabda sublineata]
MSQISDCLLSFLFIWLPLSNISLICNVTINQMQHAVSLIIFNNIFLTSKMIVDEIFHLPLGKSYCKYNFFVWDPKVTTLPGLYLITAIILGPLKLCGTYWLRFLSLAFSIVNVLLFYILFAKYEKNEWGNILSSITLALLPPLYFFSHFYYTDVISLTMILLMLVASEKEHHYIASLFGYCSVFCRQTNIIWVVFLAGKYVMTELYLIAMKDHVPNIKKGLPAQHIRQLISELIRYPMKILASTNLYFWFHTMSYTAVVVAFLIFLKMNGGIVLGDRTAHQATIHIPQLFYFSLFSLIFAWPHFVGEVLSFLTFTRKHKKCIFILIILSCVIVLVNTQVHPYMLADNRHYIFYIWNRFYGKYDIFRYAMVPVYIFSWYCIIKLIYDGNDVSFLILYLICVTAVLVTQKLIEVRYFFIPYILFRLRLKSNANNVFNLILEFVTYLLINAITLNLFFTKKIAWANYLDPQRLIW